MLSLLIASMFAAAAPAVVVSDSDALEKALASAHPHQTITLAPGTYRELAIRDVHADDVTVTSADPRHMAVISGLKMSSSSGLKFTNLEFTSAGCNDIWYAFRVAGSQDITFDRMIVHGDKAKPITKQLNGFLFTGSTNIRVTNSNLHDLSAPVVAGVNDHITIENNFFHEMNKGGIEMGGSSDVVISGNEFTNFRSAPGVHGDAVQMFTYRLAANAHDIVITDNLIYRGDGVPAQGIFLGDEGHLPYYNVTITKNVIIGGDWNSLALGRAAGTVRIQDNVVTSWSGYDVTKGATTGFAGWIFLGDMSRATVIETGNSAQSFVSMGRKVPPPRGNKFVGSAPSDHGAAMREAWLNQHPTREYPTDQN